jgi:hypothetical protein
MVRLGLLGGIAFATALAAGATSAAAAPPGAPLTPPSPGRLVVESQQRVSDGRKLQRDADDSLRKAENEPPPAHDKPAPAPAPARP